MNIKSTNEKKFNTSGLAKPQWIYIPIGVAVGIALIWGYQVIFKKSN